MADNRPKPRRSIGFRRTSISTPATLNTQTPTSQLMATPLSMEPRRRDALEVRDPDYQSTCINTVTNFLVEHQFPITTKTLLNPSSKDFQNIFTSIIRKIDNIKFERFEDEAFNFLKCLKYPFISELNRSSMKTVTPHMWPVLLSMLAWLVETVNNSSVGLFSEKEINTKTYLCFLDGEDDEMNKIIENYKENILKSVENEIQDLIKKEDELKLKIKSINITDNNLLLKEFNEIIDLNEEIKKNLKKLPVKIQKTNEEKDQLIKEYLEVEDKIKEVKKFNEKLNNRILNQEMNMEEYLRLKKELSEFENQMENLMKVKKEVYQNMEGAMEKLKIITEKEEDFFDKIQQFRKLKIDLKNRNFKETFLEAEKIKDERNKQMILMNTEVGELSEMEKNKLVEIERYNQIIEKEGKELSQIASAFLEKKHTNEMNQACCMKDIDKMKNKFYSSADIESLSLFRLTNELEKERMNYASKLNAIEQNEEDLKNCIKVNLEVCEEILELFETQAAEIELLANELAM
ncbi:putative kinetochore protein NDC80 [Cucumispora dikerogammari]|nr:putative kinetochore protein NDC80 [Cucumispora dikerogammari]